MLHRQDRQRDRVAETVWDSCSVDPAVSAAFWKPCMGFSSIKLGNIADVVGSGAGHGF